jgi:UDPglucose 6-dehydrogenase
MVFMKRRSAELTKYACNDFLALKISYINEMADFCEMIGANIEEVARGMSFDPRIGDKYLQPGIGYGGSCFPKDTKALYAFAKQQYGFDFKTIKATIDVNSDQKNRLFFKARRDVGSFQNKNVSILGLTFKPGTDDLRESPAFNTISSLLKDGANVFAYDPIGINNMKKWHETDIVYCSTALEALSKSNIIMILTDWNEFKSIPLDLFSGKRIYDGRNCLSMDVSKYALSYYSVGRI